MLDANDVRPRPIDPIRRVEVVLEVFLSDLADDFRRIGVSTLDVAHGVDVANDILLRSDKRLIDVEGERRDAATPRRKIADQRDAQRALGRPGANGVGTDYSERWWRHVGFQRGNGTQIGFQRG